MKAHATETQTPSDAASVPDCKQANWKRQFGHPSGRLGRFTGWLMGIKNAPMHAFAVEALDVQPGDKVLEIGFGHGRMVERIAARATGGFTAGVDTSDVMVAQATRRNRAAIDAGRVELKLGSVSEIPFDDGSFDKVCEANTFHHWPSRALGLEEVRRVLKPGGTLLLCIRGKAPAGKKEWAPGYSDVQIELTKETLLGAGFSGIRTEVRELGRKITCLSATRD